MINKKTKNIWSSQELKALRPPEKIKVSDWADKNRVLSSSESSVPGPWRTDRVPYLREPMDNFKNRRVKKIVLCFGTQLGKSECLLNLIGYIISQDPATALLVYPTDNLAKSVSKNRIMPMIKTCESLKNKYLADKSEVLELQFEGMYLALVGANSPSKLASRPVRYLFYDEIDKFPEKAGRDASPVELAEERTKNFFNRRIVLASSPTLETGHIWQNFIKCDMQKKYFVPCLHCGEMIEFELKNIKFPDKINKIKNIQVKLDNILNNSYYTCQRCRKKIYDSDKLLMLQHGEWRVINDIKNIKDIKNIYENIGYNINSIYSPWLTFGQIAQKYFKSKDEPNDYMNFVNGWLAQPWSPKVASMKSDKIMALQLDYEQNQVPKEAKILTCGIDVQADCFYYIVRAWGENIKSWLIDYGKVESWKEIDEILDKEYKINNSDEKAIINLCFIDSGFKAPEVYAYCVTRPGLAYPSKGSSFGLSRAPYSESNIERAEFGNLKLFILDTNYYKNFIFGRIKREKDSIGSWNIFSGIHREYADQICSERPVIKKNSAGIAREVWELVTPGAANHLLDAEVYATAAAERLGVRHL